MKQLKEKQTDELLAIIHIHMYGLLINVAIEGGKICIENLMMCV